MIETVILADASEATRAALKESLLGAGYAVTSATDGTEAKAALDAAAEDGCGPDVLLIDPVIEGIAGYDVIRLAKQRFPETVIVAISGGTRSVPAELALELARQSGAGLCLRKPFRSDELVRIVRQLTAASAGRDRTGT